MKATIDFDDALYRRLKLEAVRRGRTVKDLVAEGVRLVLDTPAVVYGAAPAAGRVEDARPAWFGRLKAHARDVPSHDLAAVRETIARARPR